MINVLKMVDKEIWRQTSKMTYKQVNFEVMNHVGSMEYNVWLSVIHVKNPIIDTILSYNLENSHYIQRVKRSLKIT